MQFHLEFLNKSFLETISFMETLTIIFFNIIGMLRMLNLIHFGYLKPNGYTQI